MFSINKGKEGPELVTIPATTFYSCSGCRFYNYDLIKSGMNPIYRRSCGHETAPISSGVMFGEGNLPFDNKTPEWCPFIKQEVKTNLK